MKFTLLILAFVVVVAYAAPQGDDDDDEIAIQEFLEKALKQSPHESSIEEFFERALQQSPQDDDESNIEEFFEKALQQSPQDDDDDVQELSGKALQQSLQNEDIQSLLAAMQEDEDQAALQKLFGKKQVLAKMQWKWFKRAVRKVKRFYNKHKGIIRGVGGKLLTYFGR